MTIPNDIIEWVEEIQGCSVLESIAIRALLW
jgi:hypothetical protein